MIPEKVASGTQRRWVDNIGAAAIVFRGRDPRQIFLDKKVGYPICAFANKLYPIGGTWIGDDALNDVNPLGTLRREIGEELNPNGGLHHKDLSAMGFPESTHSSELRKQGLTPSNSEAQTLKGLVKVIQESLLPFGDFINHAPREVLDTADVDNKLDGVTALMSVWLAPLRDIEWQLLISLQGSLGNLSSESASIVTSVSHIIDVGCEFALGTDRIYKQFFESIGIQEAAKLPLISSVSSELIGHPRPEYADYLTSFQVGRKPSGF